MKSIPQIRTRLHELADEHGIEELHDLAELTRRRHNKTRSRNVSPPLTEELIRKIRDFYSANPDTPLHEIGRRFGANQSRVSVALFGTREEA